MLLGLWAGAVALAVECTAPITEAELVSAMDGAEQSLRDLEDEQFRAGVNVVAGLLLPCMGSAVSPPVAARAHRLMALHRHAMGNEEGALEGLGAAYALAPDQGFPDDLVAAKHPLREAWAGLGAEPAMRKVPEPRYGSLAFDGTIGRERPRDLPTVAQVFDASGVAQSTFYLDPHQPLPGYVAIPRQRNLLLGCAAGSGAVALTTYGVAMGFSGGVYKRAADQSTPGPDLDRGRAAGNAVSVLSASFLTVGAGCGVGAALIGQR